MDPLDRAAGEHVLELVEQNLFPGLAEDGTRP